MVVYDKWLPLEIELLKALAKDGLSRKVIGEEMARSKNSITGACHRYEIKTGRIKLNHLVPK